MRHFPALPSIIAVERVLHDVLGPHVYVGGACVGFYVDEPGAAEIRPTDDVDIVVEIASEADRVALDKSLRAAGLQHDFEGPICRWRLNGIGVDIMPADGSMLGFSNDWYPEALASAKEIQAGDQTVGIPHVCVFIATKVDAFKNRGKGDFLTSADFEDVIRILDGCSTLQADLNSAPSEARTHVRNTFSEWLQLRDFSDAIVAHLVEEGGREREELVLERIELF